MRLFDRILDLIYPDSIYCMGCGAIIDKTRPYALCDSCRAHFHFAEGKTCRVCGRILSEDYYTDVCNDCRFTEREFDKGYACIQYGLYEREMVRAFKYNRRAYYGRTLGKLMAARLCMEGDNLPKIDLVVPVPLHENKLKARGYNQAELLAKSLADELGVRCIDALMRQENTRPMAHLTKEERMQNLDGAFSLRSGYTDIVSGRNVLIVDDIFTTGSTMDTCAKVLHDEGAKLVIAYSLAAGGNPSPEKE